MNVCKSYIPLCAVLIGIVGIGMYMSRSHSVGEQSERNPEMKRATTAKQAEDPFEMQDFQI